MDRERWIERGVAQQRRRRRGEGAFCFGFSAVLGGSSQRSPKITRSRRKIRKIAVPSFPQSIHISPIQPYRSNHIHTQWRDGSNSTPWYSRCSTNTYGAPSCSASLALSRSRSSRSSRSQFNVDRAQKRDKKYLTMGLGFPIFSAVLLVLLSFFLQPSEPSALLLVPPYAPDKHATPRHATPLRSPIRCRVFLTSGVDDSLVPYVERPSVTQEHVVADILSHLQRYGMATRARSQSRHTDDERCVACRRVPGSRKVSERRRHQQLCRRSDSRATHQSWHVS